MTVAIRYVPFDLTLSPRGDIAAPVHTRVPLEDCLLRQVTLRVPPGPLGTVGWYVEAAGTPIVPWEMNAGYVIANDEALAFDVNVEVSNGLTIVAYNLGQYSHTLYFRFVLTPISIAGADRGRITPIVFG